MAYLSTKKLIAKMLNRIYIVRKVTDSGTTVQITVIGHANRTYDRIQIWCFGNMNAYPLYGVITTRSESDGTNPTATFTGNEAHTCTYANSGNDRVITISGLRSWGYMMLISDTPIK